MNPHEEALIRAFIDPARRPRWLESLASPRKRGRMLDKLNHCRDLDPRYLSRINPASDIAGLLRSHGAAETCYVLSATTAIDGRTMNLSEALVAAEAGGWGTLIGCIPGRLAYFYDECGERRMLLQRPAS